MTTKQRLEQARALIASPEAWCRGFWARDERGEAVAVRGESACSFCAEGATVRVGDRGECRRLLDRAARKLGCKDIVSLNDTRTHAEVLAAFDLAAELADE